MRKMAEAERGRGRETKLAKSHINAEMDGMK